jgi:hypothetical protein
MGIMSGSKESILGFLYLLESIFRLFFPSKKEKERSRIRKKIIEKEPEAKIRFEELYKKHIGINPNEIIKCLVSIHNDCVKLPQYMYFGDYGKDFYLFDMLGYISKNSENIGKEQILDLVEILFWEEIQENWDNSCRGYILKVLEKYPLSNENLHRFEEYLKVLQASMRDEYIGTEQGVSRESEIAEVKQLIAVHGKQI